MDRKIRILMIMPDGKVHKLKIGSLIDMSFREAPLTLTTLAALIPEDIPAEVELIDESVQQIHFKTDYDLVAISCMTGTSIRAYDIADFYRGKNIPVVLGGVHVTLLPDEAAARADAIVVGFGEESWPRLIRDFYNGTMKKRYSGGQGDISHMPPPKRILQKKSGYMTPNTVMATRGCKGTCEFCSVPAARMGWQKRPISHIIDEIRNIKAKRIVFSDVHITQDPEWAKELFKAMIPLKKQWGALASVKIGEDEELLDLMRQSGCVYLLVGFESFNQTALSSINKGFNKVDFYRDFVNKLHNRNIIIQGCFIFGFEDDHMDVFGNTIDIINDLKVDIPRFAIFTPYPGTEAFKRLESQGRLLHRNWNYYDTQHVVFVPNRMSALELEDRFKWTYKECFKLRSNLIRTSGSGRNFYITFLGNLAYKIYVKKLYSSKRDPFPADISPGVLAKRFCE